MSYLCLVVVIHLHCSSYETIDPAESPSGLPSFVTSELNRQVVLGVRSVEVTDYEIITLFELKVRAELGLGGASYACMITTKQMPQ